MTLLQIGSQIFHIAVCTFSVYGVLFSQTPLQCFVVLSYLLLIFLGLRLFKGCMLTEMEQGETTRIGMAFMLEDPESISTHNFEEVTVGFSLLLQIIRTGLIMLNLQNGFEPFPVPPSLSIETPQQSVD